jgi:hypothetical protein
MTPETAELDARISELTAEVGGLAEGSAEYRAARVRLAASLGARYAQHGGADGDRALADQIAQDVLADESATVAERQSMSMLRATLTMLTVTPAAALRGHGSGLDSEALRRTEQWRQTATDSGVLNGLSALMGQLDAIEDTESLPPQIRSSLAMVRAAMGLLADVERPDWDGQVAPEVSAELREAVESAHPEVPGLALMRGLATWVGAPASPAEQIADLQAAIADLAGDQFLAPLLRRDLARALLSGPETGGGPDALDRVTELLEQAAGGLPEDHPSYQETVRMLAGALVAVAASDPTAERLARAQEVAARAVLRDTAAGTDRGPALFLRSLAGLLRGLADAGRDSAPAVNDLVEAIAALPVEHPLRPVAIGQLGAVLADRHLMDGLLDNADASVYVLGRAVEAVSMGSDDGTGAFIACIAAVAQVNRAMRLDDAAATAEGARRLREGLAGLPVDHPMRANVTLVLAVAELKAAVVEGKGVRGAVAALRRVASGSALVGVAPTATTAMVETLDVLGGLLDSDPEAIVASIGRMEAALTTPVAFGYQLVGQRALLGKSYLAAIAADVELPGAPERAVEHLEEARRLLGEQRADVPRIAVLSDLAVALRAQGNRDRSRRVGFELLEAYAGVALLQSGVAHAVTTARGASVEAARLARWCLADGDFAGAIQAVELGRGLALHAATSASHVPTLLEQAGRADLARAWRQDAFVRRDDPAPWMAGISAGGPDYVPDYGRAADDLRHRVLDVLRSTPDAHQLFTAPSPKHVGRALGVVGRDVLAYLLPGAGTGPGYVLVVDSDGAVTAVEAPRLQIEPDGPLAIYLRTARTGDYGQATAWRAALERVCAWAGAAALEPLLSALGRRPKGEVPRVALVPCGALGAVPWQAAWVPSDTRSPRFACQDLVLSVAASARQLVEVASRAALPLGLAAVLVTDPTGGLSGAPNEVPALRDAFYPGAVVLGDLGDDVPAPHGPGTPDEVLELLAQLPGAHSLGLSLLHLSCHATSASTPGASHVQLTAPLSIQRILENANGRPTDAPGPTVVISACDSDVTLQDYDEALTIATAFLAAGAVTVVGSRWAVLDQFTPVAMFAFHHFLAGGAQAADALRSAQLWMLDPERAALPGMPATMLRDARRRHVADIAVWAAFGHHGR